jgi:hypothetical protein
MVSCVTFRKSIRLGKQLSNGRLKYKLGGVVVGTVQKLLDWRMVQSRVYLYRQHELCLSVQVQDVTQVIKDDGDMSAAAIQRTLNAQVRCKVVSCLDDACH